MIGVLRSVYDRKTGECLGREIIEVLGMTEEDYYKPLIKIIGDSLLKELSESGKKRQWIMFRFVKVREFYISSNEHDYKTTTMNILNSLQVL